MLEIVEHEEHLFVAQMRRERLAQRCAFLFAHAGSDGNRGVDRRGVADTAQGDDEDTVRERL